MISLAEQKQKSFGFQDPNVSQSLNMASALTLTALTVLDSKKGITDCESSTASLIIEQLAARTYKNF